MVSASRQFVITWFGYKSLIAVSSVAFAHMLYRWFNHDLPPGPTGWPIIGYISCFGEDTFTRIQSLHKIYGDVFSFRVLNKLIIVVNNKKIIEKAIMKHRQKIGRYTMCINDLMANGEGLSNYDTPRALQLRQAMVRHIYGKNGEYGDDQPFTTGLSRITKYEVAHLIRQLCLSKDRPVDIVPVFRRTVWNIMWNFVFGNECNLNNEEITKILEYINQINLENRFFQFRQLLPQFCVYFIQHSVLIQKLLNVDKLLGSYKFVLSILSRELNVHLNTEETNPHCIIQKLLHDQSLNLSNSEMQRMIYELMAAGTDTTSLTLMWACDYLSELETDSSFNFNEDHLDMIHRRASVVPLALPHFVRNEFYMNDYRIPQGSILIFNIYGIHYNQLRCTNKEQVICTTDTPIPFSVGSRSCPGQRMATTVLNHVLRSISGEFRIRKTDSVLYNEHNSREGEMKSHIGLTRAPMRTKFTFTLHQEKNK